MRLPIVPLLIAAGLSTPATANAARQPPVPNEPVAAVDLERYAGTWYEQAHLPMFFQRKCIADTTAHYTVNADGTVGVRNRCRTQDGSFTEALGIARMVDGRASKLEVRFAPAWLSWLPMVWGDYWVIALDDTGYQWAMVGSPGKDYLWILSRTPQLDPEIRAQLIDLARAMDYPVDRLIDTPQRSQDPTSPD
ncbi:MAG: lipocalin family protein [Luteimonas sp.]